MIQAKYLEALSIAQRAAAIFHKTLGPGHEHTQLTASFVTVLKLAPLCQEYSGK